MHIAATRQLRDVGGTAEQGDERGGKQKPTISPSLPPCLAREKKEAPEEVEETMTGFGSERMSSLDLEDGLLASQGCYGDYKCRGIEKD
jgi:hypothetical protein